MALCCVVLLSALNTSSLAAPSEYEIKAAFLFNFASYVEWPPRIAADSSGTVVIGVCGNSSFAGLLDQAVAGKNIAGRKVEVKRFALVRDLKPCHILFIPSSEEGRTGRILSAVKGWNVLTVGEAEGFARNGGIIGFFLEDKKVRFEINPDEARKKGLKISSKLLKLARVVRS